MYEIIKLHSDGLPQYFMGIDRIGNVETCVDPLNAHRFALHEALALRKSKRDLEAAGVEYSVVVLRYTVEETE